VTVVACAHLRESILVGAVGRKGDGRYFSVLRELGGVSSQIQSVCAGERRKAIGMAIDQTTFWFFHNKKGGARVNKCNKKTESKGVTKVKVKKVQTRLFQRLVCSCRLWSKRHSTVVFTLPRSDDLHLITLKSTFGGILLI
jgi:hypothetical protein